MARTIEQLYALEIPEIQELFLQAMQNVVDKAMLDEMIKAIENNDAEALYRASGFTPAVLNPILDRLEEVYQQAGDILIDGWPKRIKTPFGLTQSVFNMRNEKVELDLKKYSSDFVTNITNEVKENLRVSLSEGMAFGDNPRQTALNIVGRVNPITKKREGGIIGLSTNQTRWVYSTRKYLEQLDNRYFTLELRDKRFDSIVKKAILEQKKLNKEDISKLITAYEKKALKFRGDAIARTETMQSINRGERAAIVENIDEGIIKADQVNKWWDSTHDGRTRLTHMMLGKTYNKDNMIGFDEPFVTVTGSKLLHPGDKSLGADAREIIGCRCRAVYDVDFLAEYR